ncbi:MAG: 4-hydroxythreonine-4-phosphate dehydrogenase PdxA [Pyrinomonadaceae bacterium]
MPTLDLPIIGITMGDAAGIGPEITLKALSEPNLLKTFRPVIIGDIEFLRKESSTLGLELDFIDFNENEYNPRQLEVFDLHNLPDDLIIGSDNGVGGKASAEYIKAAVKLWRDKKIDAIATAPISKKAIGLGGYNFPGHTEFLAELTSTKQFAMSFFAGKLRVVLLSTHVSLKQAIELVKKDALVDLILFSQRQITRLLGREARIAVAGLNPHASEGGMFGSEEANEILPAIFECRGVHNIEVFGPFSPDTIFLRGFNGEFDAVIACYHDQATIAVKSLSFGSSVNVTLGLPLIRTSVDHGTAFDIAGKGIADESSMKAAIALAVELSKISR